MHDAYHVTIHNRSSASGVTRVDVTRGGNWRCHPIFPEKMTTFFRHRPLQKSDDLLAVVSSQLPPSYVVYPLCSTVLSEFGHKAFLHSVASV